MARTDTLNLNRRKLLRKTITHRENTITLLLVFTVLVIVAWFLLQRDNYNPEQRDIPVELLSRSASPKLYKPPVKIWADPSQTNKVGGTKIKLEPFPESILALNWQLTGRIRTFEEDTLFEKINGEAEKFIKQRRSDQLVPLVKFRRAEQLGYGDPGRAERRVPLSKGK